MKEKHNFGNRKDLLRKLNEQGIEFKDLHTAESSLEDIFVNLVRSRQ